MSDFTCPSCGAPLTVSAAGTTSSPEWKTSHMQTFALGDGAQIGAFKEMTRTMPTRNPTREGDVIVPLAQASITALCVGILSGIITLWQRWSWPIPFVAFSVVLAISWWWLLLDHRSLLRVTERVIGRDIDGDGLVGFGLSIRRAARGKCHLHRTYVRRSAHGTRHAENIPGRIGIHWSPGHPRWAFILQGHRG